MIALRTSNTWCAVVLRNGAIKSKAPVSDSAQQSAEADSVAGVAARRSAPPAAAAPRIESFAEIRFYDVAPEHFEIFKKELAAEANIESESKIYAKDKNTIPNDRHLLIKVTILPPDSAASSR